MVSLKVDDYVTGGCGAVQPKHITVYTLRVQPVPVTTSPESPRSSTPPQFSLLVLQSMTT